jgi:hypothetical protein
MKKEYAARAASYEEAENTKHTARYYYLDIWSLLLVSSIDLPNRTKNSKY